MVLFYILIGGYMTLITSIAFVASRSIDGVNMDDSVTSALHSL